MHVTNTSVACDMLADDTTLHTSEKDIMQVEHTLQESLDQVYGHQSKENPLYDNRYKAEASAVTFIAWSVTTWSESWTSGRTPTFRNNYRQQTSVGYTYWHTVQNTL